MSASKKRRITLVTTPSSVITRYYPNTRLPIDGWIHPCCNCEEKTGKTLEFDGKEVPYCGKCCKRYEETLDRSELDKIALDKHARWNNIISQSI